MHNFPMAGTTTTSMSSVRLCGDGQFRSCNPTRLMDTQHFDPIYILGAKNRSLGSRHRKFKKWSSKSEIIDMRLPLRVPRGHTTQIFDAADWTPQRRAAAHPDRSNTVPLAVSSFGA